jgi:putative membrane protein
MSGIALTGTIFVSLAAVLHVLFFLLESIWFTRPAAWRRFRLQTQEQADIVRPMAFNQGFYNLFLALGAGLGLILYFAGNVPAGLTLVLFTTACMVLAAIILASTSRGFLVAALVQGVPPLLGLVFFAAAV